MPITLTRAGAARALKIPFAEATDERINERLAEVTAKLAARDARERSFEDPTGIVRDVDYVIDPPDERQFVERAAEAAEVVLDDAVRAGKIHMDERETWRPRLQRDPDFMREVIEDLPENRRFAEQAAKYDRRLRALDDEFDQFMGIDPQDRVYEEIGRANASDAVTSSRSAGRLRYPASRLCAMLRCSGTTSAVTSIGAAELNPQVLLNSPTPESLTVDWERGSLDRDRA